MALSSEDKADVKGAMGKAIANKVSKVTRDKNYINRPRTKRMVELGIERADVINARMALKYPKSAEDKAKVTRDKPMITLKSGEKIEAGKKYREPAKKTLKSWGDEVPSMGAKSKALSKKSYSGSERGKGEKWNDFASRHGYKSKAHMDKARSSSNYMPGPGSPKY